MKKAKLLERARRNPAGLRFTDLCHLAEAFGFERERQRGSHVFYVHSAARLTLNFQNSGGQAKPYQVRQLLDAVDRRGLKLEE